MTQPSRAPMSQEISMSNAPVLVVHASAPIRTRFAAALRKLGADTAEAVSATDALHYLSREPLPSSFMVADKLDKESGIGLVHGLTRLSRTRDSPVVLVLEDSQAIEQLAREGMPGNVVPISKFGNLEMLVPALVSAYDGAGSDSQPRLLEPEPAEPAEFAEMDRALECFSSVVEMVATNRLPGPIMPSTLAEVRRLQEDADTDFRSVGALVEKQTTLAARVLKMANSAFYNRAVAATTVPQALSRLGLKKALALLQAVALKEFVVGSDENLRGLIGDNLRQGYLVAVIAQRLAQDGKHADPAHAYTLGLFHNIGPTFLAYTLALLVSKKKIAAPDVDAVRTISARKCAELGMVVGKAMDLPDEVGQIFTVEAAESSSAAVQLTHQAMWMASRILDSDGAPLASDPDAELLGVSESQLLLIGSMAPELLSLLADYGA